LIPPQTEGTCSTIESHQKKGKSSIDESTIGFASHYRYSFPTPTQSARVTDLPPTPHACR
jgi:hypothetical protein